MLMMRWWCAVVLVLAFGFNYLCRFTFIRHLICYSESTAEHARTHFGTPHSRGPIGGHARHGQMLLAEHKLDRQTHAPARALNTRRKEIAQHAARTQFCRVYTKHPILKRNGWIVSPSLAVRCVYTHRLPGALFSMRFGHGGHGTGTHTPTLHNRIRLNCARAPAITIGITNKSIVVERCQ